VAFILINVGVNLINNFSLFSRLEFGFSKKLSQRLHQIMQFNCQQGITRFENVYLLT